MYQRAYGILETLAPLHVGASAGEETGNLNLIFRDQFTQTGIIPGSSIRGRFRADMRGNAPGQEQTWYGHEAVSGQEDSTTEAIVKFEYASLVWLPVFCPGQPVVWVSCPWLLKRYKQIRGIEAEIPDPYSAAKGLAGRNIEGKDKESRGKVLFFNLGFLKIKHDVDLSLWKPEETDLPVDRLVVVDNNDMGMIHDMALYRQSRVKLGSKENPNEKKVDGGAFFNVEALPEASVLIFPIALKKTGWQPFGAEKSQELYFGGLESIGFGRCRVTLGGAY
jgi:CRISPR-associated protein Cmr4